MKPPASINHFPRLREYLVRLVFGNDVFISYSRKNTDYVLALANRLQREGLVPYVDQWASPVGAELPSSLKRALKRSSMLVVVATEESGASDNVALEIESFLPLERAVCLLDVDGALARARWRSRVPGPQAIPERGDALKDALPSAACVRRILDSAKFVRARTRTQRLAASTVLLMFGAAALLAFLLYQARKAQRVAAEETDRARVAASKADTAEAAAARQLARAQTEASRADDASQRARSADEQREHAEQARDIAKQDATRFDALARSRKLAQEALQEATTNPKRGLSKALAALEAARTPEAVAALRVSLATPRPAFILEGRWKDIALRQHQLLTVDAAGKVGLWNIENGARQRTLDASATVAEWSHNGRWIVTTRVDGTVGVWDATSGEKLPAPSYRQAVLHASFSQTDDWILSGHAQGLVMAASFQGGPPDLLLQVKQDEPVARIWDDGDLVVWLGTSDAFLLGVFRVVGDELQTIVPASFYYPGPLTRPHQNWLIVPHEFKNLQQLDAPVPDMAATRLSGRHLAVATGGAFGITATDRTANVWHLWRKRRVHEMASHESPVLAAQFSDDGQSIVTLTELGIVRLWRFSERILNTDRPVQQPPTSLAFSADGKSLADGDKWGNVQVWDVDANEVRDAPGPAPLGGGNSRVGFDATGSRLAASVQGGLAQVLDTQSLEPTDSVLQFPAGMEPRFSKNARFVVTASAGKILFRDLKNRDADWSRDCDAKALAIAPSGDSVLVVEADGRASVHDARTWRKLAAANLPSSVTNAEFDGRTGETALLWGPGGVYLWAWSSHSSLRRLETSDETVSAASFGESSAVISVATSSGVRVFESATGELLETLDDVETKIGAVAFNESQRLLATAGSGPIYVRRCQTCIPTSKLVEEARLALTWLSTQEQKLRAITMDRHPEADQ